MKRTIKQKREPHPCINWDDIVHRPIRSRKQCVHVGVTCPECSEKRYLPPAELAKWVKRGGFSGLCRSCMPRAQKTTWVELSPGRKVDPHKGYVRLSKYAVPEEHKSLWTAVARNRAGSRTSFVFEHRYVMSVMLGRAVTRDELVDHMDGDKTNNHPSNLRLYRRGKNDPGDTSGYGTFYHEWQLALAEVARLKAELAKR